MYARSGQGRFPRDLRVPKNYAGNAFRASPAENETKEPIFIDENTDEHQAPIQEAIAQETKETLKEEANDTKEAEQTEEKRETRQTGLFSFPKLDIGLGKLFSRGGLSLGFEELLLLGLILLIANEGKGDDLILLLILLLFVQ
ncbi:MAG: hypothetical protein E7670_08420 [Ruminococcaceae bacterium]|nr:hypothetical protein [Oscillospiraceae bacterium]